MHPYAWCLLCLSVAADTGYVMDDTTIRTAVAAWVDDATAAEATYGHISTWETSEVTDMSKLFCGDNNAGCPAPLARYFNDDISAWNTSSVRTFSSMFFWALAFNQPIGAWDTSSATTMNSMFFETNGASSFNQPIGAWRVNNVVSFDSMFRMAKAFNQPLGDWSLDSAISMENMFRSASSFNQPLSDWHVYDVRSMYSIFNFASSFNQDLGWCVDDGVFDPNGYGYTIQESLYNVPCA